MSKRIDLTGKKFGEWQVLQYIGDNYWRCKCSCGKIKDITSFSLRQGTSTSCGCKTNKEFQDLRGKQFGEWLVLEYTGHSMWKCQCSCGVVRNIHRYSLTSGGSKSCGHNTTKFKNIAGQQFGEWTVLDYAGNQYWRCKCSCGKIVNIHGEQLRSGHSKSCGHNSTSFKDITNQVFGELYVIEYIGNQKWRCRCSCGKETIVAGTSLRTGHTKSCGHTTNQFKDLTGKHFGEWTVLAYAGNQRFKCKCSCGKEQAVSSWMLRSGKSKSCGHSTVDFEDLVDKQIGCFKILEYTGNYKYKCQCSCGKEQLISRYNLTNKVITECPHTVIDYNSMIGKTYGEWKVLDYIGNQRFKCQCSCGTLRIITERSLRTEHTRSCGCKKYELFRATMLKKYGEIATNKIYNPREKWQIDLISSKETLESLIINMSIKLGRSPKLSEISELLDVNLANTGKLITKYELNDLITYGTFSETENEIYEIVKDICSNKYNIQQRNRDVLNGLELDIYIPDRKFAIEYNGDYWHSDQVKGRYYHQEKTKKCIDKGIRLIHIFEHEWNDYDSQLKIIELLDDILNTDTNIIVNARDCDAGLINGNIANDFLKKYHLQGGINAEYNYGITTKDNHSELLGVMTFGKPRFNSKYQYELYRLCWKPGTIVNGGTEKMFKHFIREVTPKSIITYSDASKFTGTVYERLGFKNLGLTEPNYKWVNRQYDILTRYQTQKQKLLNKGLGTEDQTEDEIMNDLGYYKIYDCGNYKFEYIFK